ncbi:hypothetical protein N183_09815 [Sinorhizobium sp. Sb3]|nr:hypothetical protein N183_09815 [Sinorhizobium sp. Sb3]
MEGSLDDRKTRMNGNRQTIDDSVLEAAATWVAKLQSDDATAADRAAFELWICAHPDHRMAYEELRALWSDLGDVPIPSERLGELHAQRRRRVGGFVGLCLAAGFAMLSLADDLPLPLLAPDSVANGDGDEIMSETSKTALVRILGRVQGVSFRVWARDEAQKLGLVGWVRNEADGSVAALISGPEEAITLMLERLHEGPPAAWVSKVVAEFVEAPEGVSGFRITR